MTGHKRLRSDGSELKKTTNQTAEAHANLQQILQLQGQQSPISKPPEKRTRIAGPLDSPIHETTNDNHSPMRYSLPDRTTPRQKTTHKKRNYSQIRQGINNELQKKLGS